MQLAHEVYVEPLEPIIVGRFTENENDDNFNVLATEKKVRGRRQSIFIFFNGIVPLRKAGGGGKGTKIREDKMKISVGEFSWLSANFWAEITQNCSKMAQNGGIFLKTA